MINYLLLIFFLISLQKITNAQNVLSPFTLEGKINAQKGEIIMIPNSNDYYYPGNKRNYETKIINGDFIIKDSIYYAYPFRIIYKNEFGEQVYVSDIIFIDPGMQHIICNKDSLREIPDLENKSMHELCGPYGKAMNSMGNGSNNYSKGDSILLQYTKANPNSFIALWELIFRLSNRYEPIFDSIYSQFSPSIKDTYTGNNLRKKLPILKSIGIGSIFPPLLLRGIKNLNKLKPINGFKKYTLIDFWFAHCPACISEYPELKKIYESYSGNGFNIIGISIDKKEMINDWEKVIKEYKLPWTQYLDMNGKETENLDINAFPTNFLLDNTGKIITRDIYPDQLEVFLKKNLN